MKQVLPGCVGKAQTGEPRRKLLANQCQWAVTTGRKGSEDGLILGLVPGVIFQAAPGVFTQGTIMEALAKNAQNLPFNLDNLLIGIHRHKKL